ncbi:phytanoyl-CoA dioxygenase family protein [Rhizohabitans arisaemae]|uniref:phytanoyl-CoA dioxygenase family protein n=1 Tax=Rhizohabitans arisaemae TaxID=2720610 RepID=UPI0024B04D2A|nr:phytanoyl-CoA dioxygenase family protein [Rhizohabitans arisaemae]
MDDEVELGAGGETVRARLRDHGYFVVRGLLPADAVHAVRRDISAVYGAHGWLSPDADPSDLLPDARRRDGAPGWWRFAEDIQRLESFHRLAHHRALGSLMATIIGGNVLNHPRRHLTIVNPEFWVPPHQEYTYIQGTVDFFTAFVPFTTLTPGAGALRILQEDDLRRIRPLRILPTRGVEARVDETEGTWAEFALVPGDVVVMHSLVTRGLAENTGPAIQLAAQYRFQSRRLPVVKASLKPEHYPRLPDWPQITRGWSSRKWITPPLVPRLVPYTMPSELETWHETLATPVSSYLA